VSGKMECNIPTPVCFEEVACLNGKKLTVKEAIRKRQD